MDLIPGPHKDLFSCFHQVCAFIREEVDKHYADWDPSSPRDFIDCYLTEIQKRKDDLEAGFHEEGLQYAVLDLFVAGTETTSTTLLWAFVYMMKYPEIQEKVQAEIDKVVGQSRRPNIDDRPNMPYTDAVIHEVQRMSNVVPLSVPRMTNEDTILGGYLIPKGTQIIPNLTSVLFEQTKWKTPHSFDPQNFLNTKGEFEKPEAFIPFSVGKRSCPGESLARMELFLFFTSFLQSFTLSPPEGTQTSLDFKFGMTLSPKPFRMSFTPR
ncbi:cytochrome P450 2J2-like isoform X4 [Ctenopharyngodon idella]|nr:cytochrome P450 2J2-like isoform X4 [Ctenopharyngodon idella]